jgi:hypothetical protein
MTRTQEFCIYDPLTMICIEKVDVSTRNILFNEREVVGKATYHHSLSCYYNRLFILSRGTPIAI